MNWLLLVSRLPQFQQKNYSRVIVKAATAIFLAVCLAVAAASVSAADQKPSNRPAANSETNAANFKQPRTLAELLALPPDQLEKVDIALINLLCAEGLRVHVCGSPRLGMAYHAYSDSLSPSHTGFQTWYGPWKAPLKLSQVL
ncbi:MAG: hypothetical protein M9920_12820 [Verrucomicrobiae bacterium]|nr:hypothetical protein [Verrucomicrobiae bacterium]